MDTASTRAQLTAFLEAAPTRQMIANNIRRVKAPGNSAPKQKIKTADVAEMAERLAAQSFGAARKVLAKPVQTA